MKQYELNASIYFRDCRAITGIQIEAGFRDYKSGHERLQIGQLKRFQIGAKRLQIRAKRFQIGAEIKNRGSRDYKLGQGFQMRARITNRCRTDKFILINVEKKAWLTFWQSFNWSCKC